MIVGKEWTASRDFAGDLFEPIEISSQSLKVCEDSHELTTNHFDAEHKIDEKESEVVIQTGPQQIPHFCGKNVEGMKDSLPFRELWEFERMKILILETFDRE